MFDLNLNAVLSLLIIIVVIGLNLFFKNKVELDYYTEIKLALMLAKLSFKDIKLQKIADIAMDIVIGLENTKFSPIEKKAIAMREVTKKIHNKLGLTLDEEVLSLIIDIAVSYMQKEDKA